MITTLPLSLCDIPLKEGDKAANHGDFMYYNHPNVKLSRNLRKEMTPWERKLWYCFLKNYSVRFKRQKCIDNYIVDFYCAKAKLIIELDGSGHYTPQQIQEDQKRTNILENHGLKIIRFSNKDIDKNFYGVCTVIDNKIKSRITPPASHI